MRHNPRAWRALMIGLGLAGSGCGSDSASESPAVTCPNAAVPFCQNTTLAEAVEVGVGDANTRLLPGLSAAPRNQIAPALGALETALGAGDISGARDQVSTLGTFLGGLRPGLLSPFSPDLPTLDAIGLATLRTSEAIGGSLTTYP